jgi:protein dpy-30
MTAPAAATATPPPASDTKDVVAGTATTSDSLLPPPSSSNAAHDASDATLSTQAYLEKTVMGVLALGLEDVCRVRPTNPVDYLGSYLLRRSTANNTVEVTYDDTLPKPVAVDDEDA